MHGTLRVARPTDNIGEITRFYRDGLGFEIVASFENHNGFDGMILGHSGAPYHLEFTHAHGHTAGRAPTEDNLLVFYLPDADEWQAAVDRMIACGYQPVRSFNPWWETSGKTFADADGYRVVLQQSAWTK